MAKKKTEPITDLKETSAEGNLPPIEEPKESIEDSKREAAANLPFSNEWVARDGLQGLGDKSEAQKQQEPIEEEVLAGEAKLRATLAEPEPVAEMSVSERVLSFLKSRNTGTFVRVNDYLKSLYSLPKNNEPVEWQQQAKMKTLRAILHGMVVNKQIVFSTNAYEQLGKPYWPDDSTGKTHYHHLGSLMIEAKLL